MASVSWFTLPSHSYVHCDGWEMSTGVYEMKKLVATIALLCVSNTVLGHDIYSDL
jgi:hypothetical protein